MKTFLAVFTGSPASRQRSGWDDMDADKRKALEQSGIKAWGAWMAENAKAIAFAGGPLGKTKRASKRGVADVSNEMAGFVVLTAESHEAAARKFENHPHFMIFPGDGVDIMECLPIPGQ